MFFQDLIGSETNITMKFKWILRNVSSVPFDRQFWARCEHVNLPKTIVSPDKYKVHVLIRFLCVEGWNISDILRRIINVYNETFTTFRKQCIDKKEKKERKKKEGKGE